MYAYAGDDPVNFNDPRGLYELASGGGDPWFGADDCTVNGLVDVPGPLCGYTDVGPLGSPVYEVPSCDEVLLGEVSDFLEGEDPKLLSWDPDLADRLVLAGQSYGVDPRLMASIATLESGHGSTFGGKNNPFGLGPGLNFTTPAGAVQSEEKR
jgi:hypothetical protein